MKVQYLMTNDVQICQPEDSLNTVAEKLWTYDIGCLPVVENDHVVGMVTDRDICMAAYTQGRAFNTGKRLI